MAADLFNIGRRAALSSASAAQTSLTHSLSLFSFVFTDFASFLNLYPLMRSILYSIAPAGSVDEQQESRAASSA
jgi:hypothetical protein